jgi:nicotinamide-nucleotide amidase
MQHAPERLAAALAERGLTLSVAESLTCGAFATTLGAVEGSSDWLRGGVVAYTDDVKFDVLGVTPGPVVSARCAAEMASGVRSLLRSDVAIAVTGVGGPGSEEDKPAGTVFIAVATDGEPEVHEHRFPGPPEQVLEATIATGITHTLRRLGQGGGGRAEAVRG